MKIKAYFWILTLLLPAILAVVGYSIFKAGSFYWFLAFEGLVVFVAVYLVLFYRKLIRPLNLIGDGMNLLKEQDFSSRLRYVGQPEADRIIEVFNRMMNQLKDERLHLREQNQFLDLLIEATPLGVIMLDLDDKIVSANPAVQKLFFGTKHEENIIGKKLTTIPVPLAGELLKTTPYESRTIRMSDAGIYKCTHSTFVDKGFLHSFYLIESLTDEVFKAEKKAYEKVIRMIAHEVNNTTAGIISTLDTLNETFREPAQAADATEALQVTVERCYRMNRFITNFADVVRIPEPHLHQQDVNQIVLSSKRFMESICKSRNIAIDIQLSNEPLVVAIDSILFEQVLVNIIKNAAESIESDGQIFIRTTTDPLCLEIADTGKGIDVATESRLFTPFFSTKTQGQGLGLIFIREVLQKHGYAFSLRTYEDGLTKFRVTFNI